MNSSNFLGMIFLYMLRYLDCSNLIDKYDEEKLWYLKLVKFFVMEGYKINS